MLEIKRWTKFKRDYKKIKDLDFKLELRKVLWFLIKWEKLPKKYLDHSLKWKYKNYRECHVKNDFLLIYEIDNNDLVLYLLRIWTHSELF